MYAMTLLAFNTSDSTVPQKENYCVHQVDKNLVSSRMKYFRMLIVAFPLKILDFVETAGKKSIFSPYPSQDRLLKVWGMMMSI